MLGNDNITKKDNYFVCGGDSLLAVRMTAEIEAEFGVKVSIGIIFENNTVESLAKRISSIKEKRKPNIEVVQHNEQERFQEFLTILSSLNAHDLGEYSLSRAKPLSGA